MRLQDFLFSIQPDQWSASRCAREIVSRIYGNIKKDIVPMGGTVFFKAYHVVFLEKALFNELEGYFTGIHKDAYDKAMRGLWWWSLRYRRYIPHCKDFAVKFVSFQEGDDLTGILGGDGGKTEMYVVSDLQRPDKPQAGSMVRVTKVSRIGQRLVSSSYDLARRVGVDILPGNIYTKPIATRRKGFGMVLPDDGARGGVCGEKAVGEGPAQAGAPTWGELRAMEAARFEGGGICAELRHESVRIGGYKTPRMKDGTVGIRLESATDEYAVLSREGPLCFISGIGSLNGALLSQDRRVVLPTGAAIRLGDNSLRFIVK